MILSVFYVASCLLEASVYSRPSSVSTVLNLNSKSTLIYSGDHEITRLGVLFVEDENMAITDKIVFFIQADVNRRGKRINYGLWALTKDDFELAIVTKLLENAWDIVVSNQIAYFAAKNGIYVYNKENNTAEKYGSVTDAVISIAVENSTGVLYYLNRHHQLYKLTEDGNSSTIIPEVQHAKQITVDFNGYIYYYTLEKKVFVYNGHSIREVRGIPSQRSKIWLVRTPKLAEDYGFVNIDDRFYAIHGQNYTARSMKRSHHTNVATTAMSADSGFMVYYAADKKIYEYDLIGKIIKGLLHDILKGFRQVLDEMSTTIIRSPR